MNSEMMPVKAIQLTRGYVAIIDPADWNLVKHHSWCALISYNRVYAQAFINGRSQTLHNFLTDYHETDHINNDGLDNRRINLRDITHSDNMARQGIRSDNSTGFKGIQKNTQGWQATITVRGNRMCLGTRPTKGEAAALYDHAAVINFGEYARTNADLGLISHNICEDDCPCR